MGFKAVVGVHKMFPGAAEIPYDGIDQDCDGFDLVDSDGDGFEGGQNGSDCARDHQCQVVVLSRAIVELVGR